LSFIKGFAYTANLEISFQASSSNFSRLIRQPELQTGSNLTTARGEIFDQFQQLFMDVDEKTKQATKKKEQLVEELRQLTAQVIIIEILPQ
jgi:hypothetical protein